MRHLIRKGRLNVLLIAVLCVSSSAAHAQQAEAPEAASEAAKTDIEAMQAIENTWSQALLKHDQFALEGVLAPGFVDISEDGEVTTRNQQIARLFVRDRDAISFEQRVASVRLFGDIALVNGTYILRYTREGRTVDDKGIFSHVFQRTRSRWLCINSQRTFVVEQTAGKKPGSSLPFHLPGMRPKSEPAAPPPAAGQPKQP
ncbi:MAG TPA: nuclear transport factor 2 family protein [Acidisarcina sp.]